MAICRAEGAFGAHGAEKGGKAIGETLAPAEAHRRDGVRDSVLGNRGDDFAVWKGISHPPFAIRDVAEEPSVALVFSAGVSSRVHNKRGYHRTLASSRVIRLLMSF